MRGPGIRIVAVQVVPIAASTLSQWARDNKVPFPMLMATDEADEILSTWDVRSLPWLILTDRNHIVKANGFPLPELNAQLAGVTAPPGPWATASP